MNDNTTLDAALCAAIKGQTGLDFSAARLRALAGGCINQVLEVEAGGHRHALKLNAASSGPQFAAEAEGLAALAACDAFRVPAVRAHGVAGESAYLLLEHIPMQPLASDEDGRRFAEALVALHHNVEAPYGWPTDNFIGATPQINTAYDGWARFFIHCRLMPQLEHARAKGYKGALGRETDQLIERIPALFLDYCPRPSLLHGDLWSGNAAMDDTGRPVIFDPAVYRGDRDSDLAMAELFGGFPGAFYVAYRAAWPLAEGYEQRKLL